MCLQYSNSGQLIIMRSTHKEVYYQSWKEITQTVKQFNPEPQRYNQQLRSIVISAFGSDTHKGLIANRMSYYFQKAPSCWAEEVQQIVELFSPKSQLLIGPMGIIHSADFAVTIDPKILPKSVLSEFPPQGDKNSTMLKSLRRERGQQYFVNTWQWFWINVANALINLPEIQENRAFLDQQKEDQMYYIISRNPLLLVLRKTLMFQYSRSKDNHLLERMRGIFELFIIQDLLSYVKNSQLRADFKYQLKSQHLAAMFLLINSRRNTLQGETLQIYHEYFQRATQAFSNISPTKSKSILRNLLRTWMFFITRQNGIDYYVVKQLQNANPQTGWFRLERCPLQKWVEHAKRTDILSKEIPAITATRNNIYRLLSKYDAWSPNFSFLAVLEQFVELDKNRLSSYIKRPLQREQDEIVNKCFQRILAHLAENGADSQVLLKTQKRLNLKFIDIWDKEINVNFTEKSQQTKQYQPKPTREIYKPLNYQNPRLGSVWQHPRQQNEYQILLRGTRWMATLFDKLILRQSNREYPWLEWIRIFANPYIFLVFVLIVVLTIRSYLQE